MFRKIINKLFPGRRSSSSFRSLRTEFGRLLEVLFSILLFPVRVLFFPFEVFFKSLYRPVEDHRYGHHGAAPAGFLPATWFWTKRVGWALVMVPLQIIKAPVEFFQTLSRANRTDVLFVLPALAMIGFFAFVMFQVSQRGAGIDNRYRRGIQTALQAGNFKLAKTYFSRFVNQGKLSDSDRFQWASILSQTGEGPRAEQLLAELAPDDRKVYGPAHRLKALNLAAQLSGMKQGDPDPLILRKLRAHLENCQDNTSDINQAWAVYYLAVGDTDKAIGYLRSSAETNPRLLLTIADINQQKGRPEFRDQAVDKAEVAFRQLVEKDPLDAGSRVALANILVRKNQLDAAEQLLLTGIKLQPDAVLRRETAGFYLLKQALAAQKGQSFAEQFSILQNAMALDRDFPPIYERLQVMYGQDFAAEERDKIRAALLETVTGDKPSAMAHLALSNVLWLDGNKIDAEYHIEQAYRLDPDFSVVINNLAWMLSQREKPDLARAEELVVSILKDAPNDPRFLDTYGSILILAKRYEEAITQFQKALPNSGVTRDIHQQLAQCYDAIGKTDLAKLHRQQADKESPPK